MIVMTLTAVWLDEDGRTREQECTDVQEGDQGLHLIENPGQDQVGYIPYAQLVYVAPDDEE